MTDSQAAALLAAGRLLQSRVWPGGAVKIKKREGEAYPTAIAHVIASLGAAERNRLRELVLWVRSYEAAETEQTTISESRKSENSQRMKS